MAITFRGVSNFTQSGPERWSIDGWGMDRLTIPYRGSVAKEQAFLNNNMWSAAPNQGYMYLADTQSDGDKVYPTVERIYIGKRNGQLPPDRHETQKTIQQARYAVGSLSVDLTYISPSSSVVHWSKTAITTATISPIAPIDITPALVVWWTAHSEDVASTGLPANTSQALRYFLQRTATVSNSEEIVPNHYYRGTATTHNLVFPIVGS